MEKISQNTDFLIPDRYPQEDLFICDVADAVLKDLTQHFEHPFYSLSKKPELCIRRYEHNGNWLEITPSIKGLATIYDKDILIYCISKIMSKNNKNESISKRVRINTRDLLQFTNRGTSGRDYMALIEALDRLEGTRIRTNIVTGDEEQINGFGLIDASAIRRKHGLDGRLLWCEIILSDWIFNAIQAKQVLTLHRDYFRLRKPIERRIYEIARKHCGHQRNWKINLSLLLKKSGAKSSLNKFRYMMNNLIKSNHLPDYTIEIDDDIITFINKNKVTRSSQIQAFPHLNPETYHKARIVAPRYDIYYLEDEWREFWMNNNRPILKNPDAAFIAFCKKRYEKNPNP
ncbi:replication initiator protein A [Bartonella queenslandensis]|uniref:replication initiator protein A n=1 Tax=Bartonella queenslandensis TaxID=481138 RepID=UPI0005847231|nr:replication initiator protein A [Bartonella queenslandensis]